LFARTEPPGVNNYEDPLPTGPLSTARLLEFENGPNFNDVLSDDLAAFFASRPLVQAPTNIVTDATGTTRVFFLLSKDAPLPDVVRIHFTPTWNPVSSEVATVTAHEIITAQSLHYAWAEARLADLQTLEEIARELEAEGSRGTTAGRVKVGVEGGGMDEEAVRRESWMVREEQGWVREKFLDSIPEESTPLGLGIETADLRIGDKGERVEKVETKEEEKEDADDLFALPLSPRSPEMTMSPFSVFRGESPKAPQSGLREQVF